MLTAILFIVAVGLAFYLGSLLSDWKWENICAACGMERSNACKACIERSKEWEELA